MYSAATWSVTPRPMYPADGRKLPDVYTAAGRAARRAAARASATFPLFHFWGPAPTSRRAAGSPTARATSTTRSGRRSRSSTCRTSTTTCSGSGPTHPAIARGPRGPSTRVCGELIAHARRDGARVVVLSEYGITPVTGAVHVNRALREAGLLRVREELGLRAARRRRLRGLRRRRPPGRARLRAAAGARRRGQARCWRGCRASSACSTRTGKRAAGLDHPRSGELVAVARADRWFTYYYWLDDARAPDFARTVDIHRKPGYDPVELFLDPDAPAPEGDDRLAAREEGARLPLPDGRDPARREPRARARTAA